MFYTHLLRFSSNTIHVTCMHLYRQTLSTLRGSYRAEANGAFENPRFFITSFFALFVTSSMLLHPVCYTHFKRYIQSELIPHNINTIVYYVYCVYTYIGNIVLLYIIICKPAWEIAFIIIFIFCYNIFFITFNCENSPLPIQLTTRTCYCSVLL